MDAMSRIHRLHACPGNTRFAEPPPIHSRHGSKVLLSFQRIAESSDDEPCVSEAKKFVEKGYALHRWVEIIWGLHNY